MTANMGPIPRDPEAQTRAGQLLASELLRSDRAAAAAIPVLRHLIASEGQSLVNEAVVARVRGMLHDLACQLCMGGRLSGSGHHPDAPLVDAVIERLVAHDALLAHVHNLALEGQLAERFEQRLSLDPVLTPLLQELIASDDAAVAELAMNVLAAQARFMQSQRRMELPLTELPANLLSAALQAAEGVADPHTHRGLSAIQENYDEATTRLGLLERLVLAMRQAAVACLAFDRAGLALFASGLAMLANSPRTHMILSCSERQSSRLALALRAAGLDLAGIERQALLIGVMDPAYGALGTMTQQAAQRQLADSLMALPSERA